MRLLSKAKRQVSRWFEPNIWIIYCYIKPGKSWREKEKIDAEAWISTHLSDSNGGQKWSNLASDVKWAMVWLISKSRSKIFRRCSTLLRSSSLRRWITFWGSAVSSWFDVQDCWISAKERSHWTRLPDSDRPTKSTGSVCSININWRRTWTSIVSSS